MTGWLAAWRPLAPWLRRVAGVLAAVATAVGVTGASPLAASTLPDAEARALQAALKSSDEAELQAALRQVGEAGDKRFIAPLMELLRAESMGIVSGVEAAQLGSILDALSGQSFGSAWPAWASWYAETALSPPPGFTGWKGELLSRVDPRFGPLLATGSPARVRVEEIVWGGVPFEGIPALDRPKMVAAGEATWLEPGEPVFGIAVNAQARAYPLRILDWHEMANDWVGGVPVALTYCTLCGAGIAYDRRAPDGVTYDFGSSGLLLQSNKLMVDRQTYSLWNQFTGRPVVGPLVDEPEFHLTILPSVVTRWEAWRKRHPETKVLARETGHDRSYEPGAAYADYFAAEGTMFPVRRLPGLAPKARVFGLERNGVHRAYPIRALAEARLVSDQLGDARVVLLTDSEIEVTGKSVRSGQVRSYRSGAAVRAYAVGEREFASAPAGTPALDFLTDDRGGRWRVDEDALVGPAGQRLLRVPGILSYWFAWSVHHPDTSIYGTPSAP
jgi:hypothetical protein